MSLALQLDTPSTLLSDQQMPRLLEVLPQVAKLLVEGSCLHRLGCQQGTLANSCKECSPP